MEDSGMKEISLLSVVALLEDVPSHQLARGQVGTVVEHLDVQSRVTANSRNFAGFRPKHMLYSS